MAKDGLYPKGAMDGGSDCDDNQKFSAGFS